MLMNLRPRVLGMLLIFATGARLGAQFTESPHTVAPGRFLLEMDAITLSVKKEDDFKYTALGIATATVTTGLTSSLDLQVLAQLYLSQEIETAGFTDRHTGVGDMEVRAKWKFYDEGGTAVAVLPFIKFPTGSDGVGSGAVEGGVILPWSTQFPGGFKFTAQAEVDMLRNDADDGYDTNWGAAACASHPLVGGFGIYGETVIYKSTGGEPYTGYLGGGVTYAMSEHAIWDYALYKGFSDGANDWTTTLRFNFSF